MSALTWNSAGTRVFETGIDRGVLYLDGVPGVAWGGLISVSEAPSGGEVTALYVDGVKYGTYSASEDFEATIEAYTYPDEFDSCIGIAPVANGLFATQQKKKTFGIAYRTRVGNDMQGVDYGYKVHIVYNATAESSDHVNNTIGDTIEPGNFSWHITTLPPLAAGYAPSAHFIVDSRDTPAELMTSIETLLYGTTDNEPRLPGIDELLFIFSEYAVQDFDAGFLTETYFAFYDAGRVGRSTPDSVLDGGGA